jgi:hypothetical protein
MEGFKTARVLVLDDQLLDAMPVIKALGCLGMAAIYNDGSPDNSYSRKLTGVRVVFVDMVLAEHGADANDPATCVRMVVEALQRLIEDSNDPFIVICWTGHGGMVEEFTPALKAAFPKAKIDDILLAAKSDYERPEDLANLSALISKAVLKQNPVNILFRWEQMVHDATSQTTGEITRLIKEFRNPETVTWNDCGYRICAALALAERGTRLAGETELQGLKALFDALNPLLNDRLDHAVLPTDAEATEAGKILLETAKVEIEQWNKGRLASQAYNFRELGTRFVQENFTAEVDAVKLTSLPKIAPEPKSLLTSNLRAALNSMLHISQIVTSGEVSPGIVCFTAFKSPNRDLIKGFVNVENAIDDTFFKANGRLPENHFPFVMEISPVCDFAQSKSKLPRFIVGFVMPEASTAPLKTDAHIRILGPLFLSNASNPQLGGVYQLVLNAHYLVSVENKYATKLIPTFRMRTLTLIDLTMWLNTYANRPGLLHIGP